LRDDERSHPSFERAPKGKVAALAAEEAAAVEYRRLRVRGILESAESLLHEAIAQPENREAPHLNPCGPPRRLGYTMMSPSEYRTLRESVGSQKKVAAALGLNHTTLQRREAGTYKVTQEAESQAE
jgi:hypothetical protein